jgi:hypothetical protein
MTITPNAKVNIAGTGGTFPAQTIARHGADRTLVIFENGDTLTVHNSSIEPLD